MTETLWFKKINLFHLPLIAKIRAFNKVIIYTETISTPALYILKLFFFIDTNKQLVFLKYQVGRNDSDGRALFYKSQYYSKKIVNQIIDENKIDISDFPNCYSKYVQYWEKIIKSRCIMTSLELVKFINVIENYCENKKLSENYRINIFYPTSHMIKEIFDKYKNMTASKISLICMFNFKYHLIYSPIPGIIILNFIKSIITLFIKAGRKNISDDAIRIGTIFEEYAGNIMMERYPDFSHLFWYKYSGIAPERVVLYFDRRDTPFNNKDKSIIEKYGFSWIDLGNQFNQIKNPLKLFFRSTKYSNFAFPNRLNEFEIWKWTIIFEHIIELEIKRELYQIFNVKMVHQHQEWWPKTIVNSLAIKMENGIFVSNLWSITSFPQLWFCTGISDVIFTWGDFQVGFLNSHNFESNYMIKTGLICGDHISTESINNFKDLNANINKSVNYVIGCFDSSFGSEYANSKKTFISFYQKIIDIIYENKKMALIIKPKKHDLLSILKTENDLYEKFKKLLSDKRVIIINPIESMSYAAYFSDLTVSYGITTAGCISILMNKPNIFINLSGNKYHPLFYQDGWSNLIIDSLDDLEDKIENIRSNENNNYINNKMIDMIDTYNDGLGNKRAGEFIKSFINNIDLGENKELAFENAIMKYKVKWGEHSILNNGQKQNKDLNIWEKSFLDIEKDFTNVYN